LREAEFSPKPFPTKTFETQREGGPMSARARQALSTIQGSAPKAQKAQKPNMLWGDGAHQDAIARGRAFVAASPAHADDMLAVLRAAIVRWQGRVGTAPKIGGDLMALEAAMAVLSACVGAPVQPTQAAAWAARTKGPIVRALGEESSRALRAHPDSITHTTAPVWLEINRLAWTVEGLFRPDVKTKRRGKVKLGKARPRAAPEHLEGLK
jgi:hypothetical protein